MAVSTGSIRLVGFVNDGAPRLIRSASAKPRSFALCQALTRIFGEAPLQQPAQRSRRYG